MFRRTDSQATFGSLNVLLSPKKIAKLEKKHGAGGFRRKALPVLLANEETFRPLFCEDNGRPNKPVATTLGVIILKEMFDLNSRHAAGVVCREERDAVRGQVRGGRAVGHHGGERRVRCGKPTVNGRVIPLLARGEADTWPASPTVGY